MLTKRITFEGLEGPVTEEYVFHITQAQLIELNLPYMNDKDDDGEMQGLAQYLQNIIETNDNQKIYKQFKEIVLLAVGRKSEDGKKFLKSEEIRQDFENTEAYSELVIELMEDAEKAAKFFAGIMPAKIQEQANKTNVDEANAKASTAAEPAPKSEPRVLTQAEMIEMDSFDLRSGLADGSYVLSK